MSDDDNVTGRDVIRSKDRDFVVMWVGHCEFPLKDVEEADGTDDLGLVGAQVRGLVFEVGKLLEESGHVPGALLQRSTVHKKHHLQHQETSN